MGKLFDRLNKIDDYLSPIDKYLKDKDFYEDAMNPRFMNVSGYDELTIGEPCLRHDSDINDGYTLRIFINEKDIYFEVQTPWSSYEISDRYKPNDYPGIEDIDKLLDEILERVLC